VVSLDGLNRLFAATTTGQELALGVRRNQIDITVTIRR